MRNLKSFCVGLMLFFGACNIGCASMPKVQLPESAEMRETKSKLDEVADKLDARLEVAKGAFVLADQGLSFACSLGMSGKVCTNARKVAEVVQGHLKNADDAIDLYRETSQHFDAAMQALEMAERRVGELKTLVQSLRKGFAAGEEPDGGDEDAGAPSRAS
jgi:predicted S18 family serine protease